MILETATKEVLQNKTKEELIEIVLECKKKLLNSNKDHENIDLLFDKLSVHELLNKQLSKVKNKSEKISIIMFRIYNLEKSDDIYGYKISDEILQSITKELRSHIRAIDIFLRYNHDNFLIIATNTDSSGAKKYADKLSNFIYKNTFGSLHKLHSNFVSTDFRVTDEVQTILKRLYDGLKEVENDLNSNYKYL